VEKEGEKVSILKMVGHWSRHWHSLYKIPKGFLLIRYEPKYRKNVAKALVTLDSKQTDKLGLNYTEQDFEESLKPIDVTFDIHYAKRSLDANALMWALYEIEANEMNGYRKSADIETPEHIYEMDMKTFAPKLYVIMNKREIELLRRTYTMIEVYGDADEEGKREATVYITSSHWNTREMHYHLEMIFDRLSLAGVELKSTADISHYWMDWQQAMNDQKVQLHADDIYTLDEYRELVKNCEACGCAVWHDDIRGSVAHIKSKGAAGISLQKYHGSELMRLCDTDHALFDNGGGRDKFLKEYPHLRYKIETCLGRDI